MKNLRLNLACSGWASSACSSCARDDPTFSLYACVNSALLASTKFGQVP